MLKKKKKVQRRATKISKELQGFNHDVRVVKKIFLAGKRD